MMRARHFPFVTPTRAKAWLSCMNQAMDKIHLEGPREMNFIIALSYCATYD